MKAATQLVVLSVLSLAACSSGPTAVKDEAIEEEARQRLAEQQAAQQRENEAPSVLLNLDKVLDKYTEALSQAGAHRADDTSRSLENHLRRVAVKHFDLLRAAADDASAARNRAIAVAALGFSSRPEALDSLLNALRSDDAAVVTNAVFGLGVLKDARTPPAAIGDIVEDAQRASSTRVGAAWSLLQIQGAVRDPAPVTVVWLRLLADPQGNVDPGILVQALRGVGRTRNPVHAKTAQVFLEHPAALVRAAAAAALGYLGNAEASTPLLSRLGPEETNPNVRLAARKALQALAGGIDRGYDLKEWRRVFERGPQSPPKG